MTAYADVPAVNALHSESEQVAAALAILDGGGTMTMFTVAPAVTDPPAAAMPIAIVTPAGTVQQATVDNLIAWLTTRQSDLTAQLAALGVT